MTLLLLESYPNYFDKFNTVTESEIGLLENRVGNVTRMEKTYGKRAILPDKLLFIIMRLPRLPCTAVHQIDMMVLYK